MKKEETNNQTEEEKNKIEEEKRKWHLYFEALVTGVDAEVP